MNKDNRRIRQKNFNDRPRPNGYCKLYGNCDYGTRVNWEFTGLVFWDDNLRYYIT